MYEYNSISKYTQRGTTIILDIAIPPTNTYGTQTITDIDDMPPVSFPASAFQKVREILQDDNNNTARTVQ